MGKHIVYLLIILPVLSFAELDLEKVNHALEGIQSNKSLQFYNGNQQLLAGIENKSGLSFTTLSNADILLFAMQAGTNKARIVESYQSLKDQQDSIGAIYTKKGRTQIIFVKERLLANGLSWSPGLNKYLIEECNFNLQCFLQME